MPNSSELVESHPAVQSPSTDKQGGGLLAAGSSKLDDKALILQLGSWAIFQRMGNEYARTFFSAVRGIFGEADKTIVVISVGDLMQYKKLSQSGCEMIDGVVDGRNHTMRYTKTDKKLAGLLGAYKVIPVLLDSYENADQIRATKALGVKPIDERGLWGHVVEPPDPFQLDDIDGLVFQIEQRVMYPPDFDLPSLAIFKPGFEPAPVPARRGRFRSTVAVDPMSF